MLNWFVKGVIYFAEMLAMFYVMIIFHMLQLYYNKCKKKEKQTKKIDNIIQEII